MIKGVLIVNNHGTPRLVKLYHPIPSSSSASIVIRRIFNQVASRPDSFCNYLEGTVPEWSGAGTKLIYRHYATLYFVFAVDSNESDLGILDLIQVFVEALDKCFENVCELDLIFHSDKVHFVLDEIVMGGMVLETQIGSIIAAINDQGRLHKESSQGETAGGSSGGGGGGGGSSAALRGMGNMAEGAGAALGGVFAALGNIGNSSNSR